MQAFNHTRQRFLAGRGRVAARPWARLRGLIGRSSFEFGEGLLLMGTQGVHTIGMRFAIDVLWLDEDGQVLYSIHAMEPFRFSPIIRKAAMVLELPAGVLRETGTQVGDRIEVALAVTDRVRPSGERVWTQTEDAE
jgi:uncharacterized membrane protein (UPF0127 family)